MISPLCFWGLADIFSIEQMPKWWMKQSFYFYSAQLIFAWVVQKVYVQLFGTSIISAVLSNIFLPIFLLIILIITAYGLRFVSKPVWNVLTGGR